MGGSDLTGEAAISPRPAEMVDEEDELGALRTTGAGEGEGRRFGSGPAAPPSLESWERKGLRSFPGQYQST